MATTTDGGEVVMEEIVTVDAHVSDLAVGTEVEIVPYDENISPDQNLHEAARLILQCAEPVVEFEQGDKAESGILVLEDTNAQATVAEPHRVIILEETGDVSENEPVRVLRSTNEPKKGYCTCCQKIVEYKNRKRHLLSIHGLEESNDKGMTMSKCIYPDCGREFYMVKSMLKHLETDHEIQVESRELAFSNWEDFMQWKSAEEDMNFVFFSKRSGEALRGGRGISYFVCQRDGSKKPHRKKGYVPTGRNVKKGRVRMDLTCPARIKAYRSNEGVKVVYTYSHNHPITPYDTVHQPLSKSKLDLIKQQLEKGVTSGRIHADLSSVKPDTSRETSHIVTKRRIDNIKKKLDEENRLHSEESASVHMLITQLQEKEDSPIILYVCDFVCDVKGHVSGAQLYVPSRLFLVVYQSPQQLEVMAKFANRSLIIETDGCTDSKEIQLITLIVSDEFHCAYPVAHIITNNLQEGLTRSLQKMKERLVAVELTVVFTPNDSIFPVTVNTVFEPSTPIKFLHGRWETVRQWEKKVKMTTFSSTIRRDLSQMLTLILEEPDVHKFEILLEVFLKEFASKADRFLRFFERNYVFSKWSWARCYRDPAQFGTDKAEFMRKLTARLDWWVCERASNKRVDDLVNLVSRIDEEWSAQRKTDLSLYSEIQGIELSKHLLSTWSPDDRIHPVKLHDGSINIWFIKGNDQNTAFVVKLVEETCEFDFCWDRCGDETCAGLCSHMYTCSCEDGTGLCEHIHKVRTLCHRDSDGPGPRHEVAMARVDELLSNELEDFSEMEIVIVDENAEEPHYVHVHQGDLAEVAVETTVDAAYLDVEPSTSQIVLPTDEH